MGLSVCAVLLLLGGAAATPALFQLGFPAIQPGSITTEGAHVDVVTDADCVVFCSVVVHGTGTPSPDEVRTGSAGLVAGLTPEWRPTPSAYANATAGVLTSVLVWLEAPGVEYLDLYCTTRTPAGEDLDATAVENTLLPLQLLPRPGTRTWEDPTAESIVALATGAAAVFTAPDPSTGDLAAVFDSGTQVGRVLATRDLDVAAADDMSASVTYTVTQGTRTNAVYLGFTDFKSVWAVQTSTTTVLPIQGNYEDAFLQSFSSLMNPFPPDTFSSTNATVTVTFRWRRATRRITVTVSRLPQEVTLEASPEIINLFPVGGLHLVLMSASTIDSLQFLSLRGSVTVEPTDDTFVSTLYDFPPATLLAYNTAGGSGSRVLSPGAATLQASGFALDAAVLRLPLPYQDGVPGPALRDIGVFYFGSDGADNDIALGVADASDNYFGCQKLLTQLSVQTGAVGGALATVGTPQSTVPRRQERTNCVNRATTADGHTGLSRGFSNYNNPSFAAYPEAIGTLSAVVVEHDAATANTVSRVVVEVGTADTVRPRPQLSTRTPLVWFKAEDMFVSFDAPVYTLPASAVTVTNGAAGTPVPIPGTDNKRWELPITAVNGLGSSTPEIRTVTIQILDSAFTDASGNPNIASNVLVWTSDPFAFRVNVTTSTPFYVKASTLSTFFADFSVAPADIFTSDLSVVSVPGNLTVGRATSVAPVGASTTLFALEVEVDVDGPFRVAFFEASVLNPAGSPNIPFVLDFVYDNVPPSAVLNTTTPFFARADTLAPFTVTFSEAVRPLTPSSFNLTNGVVSNIEDLTAGGNHSVFRFTLHPASEGLFRLALDGGAPDLADNPNVPVEFVFVYDTTPPAVALVTTTPFYARAATLATFFAVSAEPFDPATFSADSFNVTGGTPVGVTLNATDPTVGFFTVLPDGDGPIRVVYLTVDRAGNLNQDAAYDFIYDSVRPLVRITSATRPFARLDTIRPFAANFSEPMRPFGADNFTVQPTTPGAAGFVVPASLANTTTSGTVWSFTIFTDEEFGNVTVGVEDGDMADLAGNPVLPSLGNNTAVVDPEPFRFVADAVLPEVLITHANIKFQGSWDKTTIPPFLVVFTESVFDATIVNITLAPPSARASFAAVPGTDNREFLLTIEVNAVTARVIMQLASGTARDASNNPSSPSSVDGHFPLFVRRPFEFDYDVTPVPWGTVGGILGAILLAALGILLFRRHKAVQRANAKITEDARRARENINRVQDVDVDNVAGRRLAKARVINDKQGVSLWSPGGWMKYGKNDAIF